MREGHLVWRAWLKQMWSQLKLKLYRSMKVLDADISHMIISLVFDEVENTIEISCDLGLLWLFISLILTIDKNIPPSKFQEPLDINFRSQFCVIIHTWDVPTVVWFGTYGAQIYLVLIVDVIDNIFHHPIFQPGQYRGYGLWVGLPMGRAGPGWANPDPSLNICGPGLDGTKPSWA